MVLEDDASLLGGVGSHTQKGPLGSSWMPEIFCLKLSAGFSEYIELLHVYDLCLDMDVYLNSKQEEGDDSALSTGSAPVCLCHLVLTPM